MERRTLLKSIAALASGGAVASAAPRARGPRHRIPGVNYAKAGETPGWEKQDVIDLDTGRSLEHCEEVDCVDGWAVCFAPLEERRSLQPGHPLEKFVLRGRFRLEAIE